MIAEVIVDVTASQVDRVFDYAVPQDFLLPNFDQNCTNSTPNDTNSLSNDKEFTQSTEYCNKNARATNDDKNLQKPTIKEGMRVVVPFGNRTIDGFVLRLKDKSSLPPEKLKKILKIKSQNPEISAEMLALCDFMVQKYNIK